MNFKIEDKGNITIVRCVSEKLDSLIAPELKTLFLHHSNNGCINFIINLSQAKYCDSSGLSALLVGNRIVKEKEGSLAPSQALIWLKGILSCMGNRLPTAS